MADPDLEMRSIPANQEQSNVPKSSSANQMTRSLSGRSSITAREPATIYLHHASWPIFVFIFYSAITLTPWIMLCILSKRPIQGGSDYYDMGTVEGHKAEYWFRINEQHFKAGRIMQSIATLFTIPITTAICSMAFVAYMQAGTMRKSLTLRKAMALADQGWLSPRVWITLVKTGSLPLYVAMALTLTGSVSQILQSAFVTQENITGDGPSNVVFISSIPDLFNADIRNDGGLLVNHLRSLLESTTEYDQDINLWGTINHPSLRDFQSVFTNEDLLPRNVKEDPYFVPLPFNFSTGGAREVQYAPRMSSTLQYTNITADEYRKGCPGNQTDSGGFYARYSHMETEAFWFSAEACMTGDLRVSPWKPIRDRQDITEELYLNISLNQYRSDHTYFKATAQSTLGYFELPSSHNGNTPGPLLNKYPEDVKESASKRSLNKRLENATYAGNYTLIQANSKGPLTSLALALFGPGSYIETRMSRPQAFIVPPLYLDDEGFPYGEGNCVGFQPFALFNSEQRCIQDYDSFDEENIYNEVLFWLNFFQGGLGWNSDVAGTLSTGLYLANKLWLGGKTVPYADKNLMIDYDDGIPTFKPKISEAGIIVGSLLLGVHLFALLLLALYACVMKPWSGKMGSEVMVKMGVVYADALARAETREQFKNAACELPGFVGDERPSEEVGRMRMGAEGGLSTDARRKFEVLR